LPPTVVHICGDAYDPPAPPTLPATGSTVEGTVTLGGGLLLFGAIIIALTRRRSA
jgi:LPXTG-motif cell wall-anchored protein